jgi:ArsR family transcriptional regulator
MTTVAETRFDMAAIQGPSTAFNALGDEIRLKIIHLLAQHEALCVCELQQAFDVEQPTISHHLKILREANLVDVERRGTWAYYSLRKDVLKGLTRTLLDVV